eukprot:PhM_4_TR10087/c3_g1_i1/m.75620/K14787/MRD1, RBM19; multiple RNA-binding domain-containing protein 1
MPPHDAVARSILNDLRSSPDTFCLSPTASIASGPESIARVVAQSLKEIAKKPETVANAIALVPNLPVMCQLVVLSQLAPLAQSIVVHPVGHALLGLFYSCSVQVPTELSATVDNIIVSEARAMLDRIMKSSSTDGGNNNGSGKGKKKRGQKQAQQGTVAVAAAVSKKDASDMTILMGLAHAVPYVGVMISQRLPAILDQPAGLELVCGLADIPEIGSYIYSDWYELARDEKKYTAVISLIRVSSLVACLFELILPDFVALCKDANKQLSQCMYELVGVLNIPQMQQLCDRLMMFDGRGPSKFIELLTTDHTFPIAYRICESAESVTRVLLVDHLRTYSFYLRGMPHEDDIVDWATRNPTYNEVIVVYDKATSQFYTMDISYTENTFNRREWLRLRGKVVHLASVCINHQNGTCRANERCNMIHVDRDVIRRLRPKSCCALHGHEGSAATLARSTRSRRMLMPSGVEVDVPECRFARTAGWDANIMTPVLQTSMVCRQHQREACGKPTNCKFIHICREFWAQNGGSSTPPNSARDGNMLTTVPAISGGNIVPSANMYTGAKESHHHGSLYHSSQSYNNNSNNNARRRVSLSASTVLNLAATTITTTTTNNNISMTSSSSTKTPKNVQWNLFRTAVVNASKNYERDRAIAIRKHYNNSNTQTSELNFPTSPLSQSCSSSGGLSPSPPFPFRLLTGGDNRANNDVILLCVFIPPAGGEFVFKILKRCELPQTTQIINNNNNNNKTPEQIAAERREKKFREFEAMMKEKRTSSIWQDGLHPHMLAEDGSGGGGGDSTTGDNGATKIDIEALFRAKEEEEAREAARQAQLADMSDLDFLKSKQGDAPTAVTVTTVSKRGREEEEDDSQHQQQQQQPVAPELDKVRMTRRVLLRNIAYSATEEEITRMCRSKIGDVEDVFLPTTIDTRETKGVALVRFKRPVDAEKALKTLHGRIFQGRVLACFAADDPPPTAPLKLTKKRESATQEKREKEARMERAWNSLYMTTDTVTRTIADKLSVDKGEMLDPSMPNVATRTAVAEAVLTQELKEALDDHGVNVDILRNASQYTQRSQTTLLVKNLVGGKIDSSALAELKKMFSSCGSVQRIVAPSGFGVVLVAFVYNTDAKNAMHKLSFKPFRGAPLFLEWAPLGVLDPTASASAGLSARRNEEDEEEDNAEDHLAAVDDAVPTTANTLHVSNIPHAVTQEVLERMLINSLPQNMKEKQAELGEKKPHKAPLRSVKLVAGRGYGFVELVDHELAKKMLRKLHGSVLEGRELRVEFVREDAEANAATTATTTMASHHNKKKDDAGGIPACPPGCSPYKLTVKNVPFEATPADIKALFATFSEVKSVRVPKKLYKYDSSRKQNHRGFAFVEFTTPQGAIEALKQLAHVHLYGRHLVLEYSKDDTAAGALH